MYAGRIIAIGKTDKPFLAYRVSSRSFPNRIIKLVSEKKTAVIPLDSADLEKNPFISYNCLTILDEITIVSNGTQIEQVEMLLKNGLEIKKAIAMSLLVNDYEHDGHFTPRILGAVNGDIGYLGIVSKDEISVKEFPLKENSCRIVSTNTFNTLKDDEYKYYGESAEEITDYIINGDFFSELEHFVCGVSFYDDSIYFKNLK